MKRSKFTKQIASRFAGWKAERSRPMSVGNWA